MKKITVLLPTNSTEFLSETLESISRQTLPISFFTVLIVLDRVEVESVRKFVSGFELDIQVISSTSPGLVNALNEGIRSITTEYIARIDSDDIMLPNRLEEQLAEMESDEKLVGLGSYMTLIDENGQTIGETTYPKRDYFIRRLLPYENTFGHPTMLLRHSALVKVGNYRHTKSEDWDLWIRLSEIGKLKNIGKPLIKYRLHSAQVSRNIPSNNNELSASFQYSRFLRQHGLEDALLELNNALVSQHTSKDVKKKAVRLSHQSILRQKAQNYLRNFPQDRKLTKYIFILRALSKSPLEVYLQILRRLNKFL